MLYLEPPKDFKPLYDVVGCFLLHNNEFLLLHRQDSKPEGDSWGQPAGKVDKGEDLEDAMLRELFQETGHKVEKSDLKFFKSTYARYPKKDFIYHLFSLRVGEKPLIEINSKEHKNYKWVTSEKALEMNLILDLDACIKLFYNL